MSASISVKPQSTTLIEGTLQAILHLPGVVQRGTTLGYIGNLAANPDGRPTSVEQRVSFLKEAKNRLFSMGAQKVIGPIDGDTWHRYRLPLSGTSLTSFLEPNYPPFTAGDFISAGMPIIATYRTSEVEDLSLALEQLANPETIDLTTLKNCGVKVRCLRLDDFENEMSLIHQFSLKVFASNFLYSDIELGSFQDLYRRIKPLLRKDLVLIAESDDNYGAILGVVLAVPDPANRSTIIVKTLARHPDAPRGLGRFLFYEVLARAHQLGYRRAECALMKDDNFSAFLPDQLEGKVIRKFALFGCSQ